MPDIYVPLPSHIYSCIELEELILTKDIILKPPPTDFKGFKHIRKLELSFILLEGDILSSLIANCPKLSVLILKDLSNLNNLVIDAPKLESMSLSVSSVGLLKLKNVPNLARTIWDSISTTTDRKTTEIADAIKHLSASCELKSLPLSSLSSKVGRLLRRPNQNVEVEHNYNYENNLKLGNLVELDIKGVTGSNAELKFIKYVLSSSIVLRKLTIKVRGIDDVVELKLQRELNAFQRASPKAQIIVS
ncbi:F-box/FBD/LRR-repeat protein At1g13570-like [Chenopodium quinoa]|nr:F-box/FBD/LRR-repeat protein At1g13570-like [Chenopodium quinoa]